MTEYLTQNKLLTISGIIICTLIGVVWSINNTRLQALEEWRKRQDAYRNAHVDTEIAITKEKVQMLVDKVSKMEMELDRLSEKAHR
jgi:hypothetical protein